MDPMDRVWRERGLQSAVLAGDEQAWQTLYRESYDALAGYVSWRCVGLCELVDEVLQDTWLTAVRQIGKFKPECGSFRDWLRGIAANVLRNQLRARRRRTGHIQPISGGQLEAVAVARVGTGPDKREQIAQALLLLPERYEAVLRAKYLDEQSVADIAQQWRETPNAIESLLTRARQAFRDAFVRNE